MATEADRNTETARWLGTLGGTLHEGVNTPQRTHRAVNTDYLNNWAS